MYNQNIHQQKVCKFVGKGTNENATCIFDYELTKLLIVVMFVLRFLLPVYLIFSFLILVSILKIHREYKMYVMGG